MSEPITLYGKDGARLTVYGRAEAARHVAEEGYSLAPPEPAEEMGAAAIVEESTVPEPPPAPKPAAKSKKTGKL